MNRDSIDLEPRMQHRRAVRTGRPATASYEPSDGGIAVEDADYLMGRILSLKFACRPRRGGASWCRMCQQLKRLADGKFAYQPWDDRFIDRAKAGGYGPADVQDTFFRKYPSTVRGAVDALVNAFEYAWMNRDGSWPPKGRDGQPAHRANMSDFLLMNGIPGVTDGCFSHFCRYFIASEDAIDNCEDLESLRERYPRAVSVVENGIVSNSPYLRNLTVQEFKSFWEGLSILLRTYESCKERLLLVNKDQKSRLSNNWELVSLIRDWWAGPKHRSGGIGAGFIRPGMRTWEEFAEFCLNRHGIDLSVMGGRR